jgi:hypothetical protein
VPSRRTFELIVITVVLMAPALAMVHLWTRKHLATATNAVVADAAAVVNTII